MFNPNEHLSKLRGKNGDYLEVKWRLVWFRDQCERGEIATQVVHLDLEKGVAVFKATVSDGQGGIATGHGSETAKDFGDYLEKAETKAIGRALAALGYGTQFAPELEEGERIVDSPVVRQGNGRQSTVAITRGDLYAQGERLGLWSRTSPEKFYAWASDVAGRAQSKAAWDMTVEEMAEMARQLYEQVPASVAGAN